jgi:hypothetical protein
MMLESLVERGIALSLESLVERGIALSLESLVERGIALSLQLANSLSHTVRRLFHPLTSSSLSNTF